MRSRTTFILSLLAACVVGCDKPQGQVGDGPNEVANVAGDSVPSGLTVVVCDSGNNVLDTVIVPDDQASRTVRFTLPPDVDEIRVFAIGERRHEELPADFYITGRPDDQKWMGLGYVEAHIEEGILVGIDGNGFGQFTIDQQLSDQIVADIAAAQSAEFTSVEITSEQSGDSN